MSQWPAEIVASCFHLIDPLSRCWIWSNHSQSPLNILFFKQNRGSKFHHSMTRSGADNTIKPIPAYPEGAISGGTAERWDYRPTERCQSPQIHNPLQAPHIYDTGEGLDRPFWGSALAPKKKKKSISSFVKGLVVKVKVNPVTGSTYINTRPHLLFYT